MGSDTNPTPARLKRFVIAVALVLIVAAAAIGLALLPQKSESKKPAVEASAPVKESPPPDTAGPETAGVEKDWDLRLDSDAAYLRNLSKSVQLAPDSPNIILILTDDMGYSDLSCFGSALIQTPNLDALAADGIALTNYYAPNAVCSPSRAGMLTGRYPLRAHVPTVLMPTASQTEAARASKMPGISPDEILLSDVLRAAGYHTACLGKWHLGDQAGYLPNDNGFEYFYGSYYSNDMEPYAYYRNSEIALPAPVDQSALTKTLTEEAVNYIRSNRDSPFFLYYASPFPHHPANASQDFQGTSQAGLYGDCVQEIDWSVGKIMEALAEEHLDRNTLVIFCSDNGPWFEGGTGGGRSRKGSNFNGGINVPCIIWMPERFQTGLVSDELVSGMDIFPTVLEMLGIAPPGDRVIDGLSILPFLEGKQDTSGREDLFLLLGETVNGVISGEYKYLARQGSDMGFYSSRIQGPFLFNLKADPGESYDLSDHHPELAEQMQSQLNEFARSIKAHQRGWIQ